MSIVEEFKKIVKNQEKEKIVPFLKKLNDEEKKTLVPIVKKYYKVHSQYVYGSASTEAQYHIASIAAFVILNYSDFSKITIVMSDEIDRQDICSWYCPQWLTQYMDNHRFRFYFKPSRQYYTSIYNRLLEYITKGYCTPTPQYIAQSLDNAKISIGDIKSITIDEHIWYLFAYETEIHKPYEKSDRYWLDTIQKLVENGSIDRKRVLQESILSSSRFNNRAITGYFFNLLDMLNPTIEELLLYQDNLLSVLANSHSKPINQTLKYIKLIYKEPSFNLQGFMEQLPILLAWDIKSIVNSTLTLMDGLIKYYPDSKEELSLLITQTLAQNDEKLQLKAIKILGKYKMLDNGAILDEIEIYADNLYNSIKLLLPTIDETSQMDDNFAIKPIPKIREDNKMPTYKSFDELVFFFSAIFQTKNSINFDIFIANIIKIDKMITTKNINKLDTVFHQAFKYYFKGWQDESNFYLMLSSFFIDYASILLNRFTKDAIKQKELLDELDVFIFENKRYRYRQVFDFENIKPKQTVCYLFAHRCQILLKHLKGELNLTCLSTPTHQPAYIENKVLIEKIAFSQNNKLDIDIFDFQIALSRCIVDKSLISYIKEVLEGEIKDIFLYFTNPKEPLDLTKVITPEYWIVAVMRKGNSKEVQALIQAYSKEEITYQVTDASNWETTEEPYHYKEWENGERVTKTMMTKKFKLERKRAIQNTHIDSIYRYLNICTSDGVYHTEINYGLLLSSNLNYIFLENLLANIANTYIDATIKKSLPKLLVYLIDTWNNSYESSYIFLAYSLTFEEKTTRTLSSELWIKATTEGTMNHQLLGVTLGKLEHNEYAPLKRFTDLIVGNMLNISSLHNRSLEVLLSSMIPQMSDEPIKGTKKLLEIYLEVLSLTKQKPSEEVLEKLGVWGEVKSLKSVINKIGKN